MCKIHITPAFTLFNIFVEFKLVYTKIQKIIEYKIVYIKIQEKAFETYK